MERPNLKEMRLKKILDNIPTILQEVLTEYHDFVEVLEVMREVRLSTYGQSLKYCSPRPNPYYKNVVLNFENKWKHLQQKYKIFSPNNVHILCQHITEYINKKEASLGNLYKFVLVNVLLPLCI